MTKQQLINDIAECDNGYYVSKDDLPQLKYAELVHLWNICCKGYKHWKFTTKK